MVGCSYPPFAFSDETGADATTPSDDASIDDVTGEDLRSPEDVVIDDAPSDRPPIGEVSDPSDGDSTVTCSEELAVIDAGHCYFPLPGAWTWTNAEAECRKRGAHLVTITSAREQSVVVGLFAANDRWIGLRRASVSAPWTWVTGEPFVFQNWGEGDPDSTSFGRLDPAGFWRDAEADRPGVTALCERD
jgi:hypothetical protein